MSVSPASLLALSLYPVALRAYRAAEETEAAETDLAVAEGDAYRAAAETPSGPAAVPDLSSAAAAGSAVLSARARVAFLRDRLSVLSAEAEEAREEERTAYLAGLPLYALRDAVAGALEEISYSLLPYRDAPSLPYGADLRGADLRAAGEAAAVLRRTFSAPEGGRESASRDAYRIASAVSGGAPLRGSYGEAAARLGLPLEEGERTVPESYRAEAERNLADLLRRALLPYLRAVRASAADVLALSSAGGRG